MNVPLHSLNIYVSIDSNSCSRFIFSPNAPKTCESESRVNGKILSSKYLAIKINNIKKINMKLVYVFEIYISMPNI